ncbi:MAG: phosphatase family protein [Aeromicrobium sp.]|uniref:phosphatase PAP2 family protein n=1 Tax=Aeromicrobium sp. TaxID=1871063 RepID=UPI0026133352|nr:phosphatase PAP2 family protein [Aeromicrobium sp.]MCW2824562.1 phosphatase family protein [Aeromicrobium sp.]
MAWWILRQTILAVGAIAAYFGARGLTKGSVDEALRHSQVIIECEQRLGIYVEESVAEPIASSPVLATLANWVYIGGHWPLIVTTMVWSGIWHPRIFVRLRDGMVVPVLMGVAVVVTANHYILDVVAGVVLVLIGHLAALALALERRRDRRAALVARPPVRDDESAERTAR